MHLHGQLSKISTYVGALLKVTTTRTEFQATVKAGSSHTNPNLTIYESFLFDFRNSKKYILDLLKNKYLIYILIISKKFK